MLWPGSLIAVADRIPTGGVVMYAMMAAGGDLGASVGPQLVGIITDKVIASPDATALALRLGISAKQLGMKCGMLVGRSSRCLQFPYLSCCAERGRKKTANKKSLSPWERLFLLTKNFYTEKVSA